MSDWESTSQTHSLISDLFHRRYGRAPIDQRVLRVELGRQRVGNLAGAAGALVLLAPAKSLGVIVGANQTGCHRGLVDRLLKARRQRSAGPSLGVPRAHLDGNIVPVENLVGSH